MSGPFELIGDPDAAVCEDGICAVPDPQPVEAADPAQTDGSADAGTGLRVPVQR
jgi:hypothetical protein